jgi:hypothetical protein
MLNLIEPMDECPLLRPGKHLLARRATWARSAHEEAEMNKPLNPALGGAG